MMTDRCAACGRPIVAVRDLGPPINLGRYVWRHRSWLVNKMHLAVPASGNFDEFRPRGRR